MTLSELLVRVRDRLDESVAGYWTDAELTRYLNDATDRHAQECHSAEWEWRTSTVGKVSEYALPVGAEGPPLHVYLISGGRRYEIPPEGRGSLMDGFQTSQGASIPDSFAFFGNVIKLNPAPNGEATAEYTETDDRDADEAFTGVAASTLAQSFTLTAETQIHNARLWLRKTGSPTGNIALGLYSNSGTTPNALIATSGSRTVEDLENWYEWEVFDWPTAPVLAAGVWWVVPILDATYLAAYSAGVTELLWGSDQTSPSFTTGNAARNAGVWVADTTTDFLFEVHPLRNDLWLDGRKNVCTPMSAATDTPDVPSRYHLDIVNLATASALRKNSFDLALATYYERLATQGLDGTGGMLRAKADSLRKGHGSSRRRSGSRHPEGTLTMG